MVTTLRDALAAAANDEAPAPTVDIDAALSIGRRRRTRRITLVAGTATAVVASVVLAGSMYFVDTPQSRIGNTAPASQSPELCVRLAKQSHRPAEAPLLADGGTCLPPSRPEPFPCSPTDVGFLNTARAVLPQVGTWSAPRNWLLPPTCDPNLPARSRGFMIEVADQQGVGVLSAGFYGQTGLTFECNPTNLGHRCQTLPEGNLWSWSVAQRLNDKEGVTYRAHTETVAQLDTPQGYLLVRFGTCVDDKPFAPPPCLAAPSYTQQQLEELAIAIIRSR